MILKDVMTTGDVARICCVAPRQAAKWIDTGLLKGFQHPGPGKDRRVTKEALLAFMKQHDMLCLLTYPRVMRNAHQGRSDRRIDREGRRPQMKKLKRGQTERTRNDPDFGMQPIHRDPHHYRCPECGHLVLMPCLSCRDARALKLGQRAAPAKEQAESLQGLGVTFEDVTDGVRRLKEQHKRELEAGEPTYKRQTHNLRVISTRMMRSALLMEDPN